MKKFNEVYNKLMKENKEESPVTATFDYIDHEAAGESRSDWVFGNGSKSDLLKAIKPYGGKIKSHSSTGGGGGNATAVVIFPSKAKWEEFRKATGVDQDPHLKENNEES